ncbi:hypothetical protein GCM10007857_84470 [Bradyrhizobium iriomotense]|uniref:Transposase n=1 Tax=Bradyrhizobium iriomotense TaxID=441950 RepID=A0ABQ6BE71_9BRAD|nr:hypothetical protein GCM10007857_84470 [Bradyrhizobium iriomotense]
MEGRDLSSRRTKRGGEGFGDWATYQLRRGVQILGTALHAKAQAEADYRFYALYDNGLMHRSK